MASPGSRQAPKSPKKVPPAKGIFLIGCYKLLEGTALLSLGFGVLRMLHRDIAPILLHWVHVLRVDPENRYIHGALERAFSISPHQLRELSVGTFIYAGLRYAEGFGLVFRKKWGQYLTIVATGLFIPLEIYEIFRHLTWMRLAVFAINMATLWYLIAALRRNRR